MIIVIIKSIMGKARRLKLQRKILQTNSTVDSQHISFSFLDVRKYISLIFVIGIIIFWKIFSNGFVWDDSWQIIDAKNSLVVQNIPQFFTNGIAFTYRPFFFSILAGINSLFGLQPVFFHAFNVILHLINTMVLFIIFQRFFTKKIGLIASLIFLIHPMNVEPVANVSFMMEPLYFLFGCLSVLICISSQSMHFSKLILGSFFILCSLLSKESGFIFIPIILSYFALFQKKHLIKMALSFGLILGLYVFMRLGIAGSPIIKNYAIIPYEPIQRLSFPERLLNIPSIFTYYCGTFFFPLKLAIQRYWVVKNASFTNFYIPLSFLLFTIGGAIYLGKKFYSNNKEMYRTFLFFLLWFTFGLIFHFQILPLTMTVADRWFYLPMVGILGSIICIIQSIPSYIRTHIPKNLYMALIICSLILLGIRAIIRTYNWKDNYTLYSHDVQVLPNNYSLHNDVGAELMKMGKYTEAKKHIDRSIELAPDWWLNWTNLATYYKNQKNYGYAKQAYEKAIENGKYKNAYIFYAKMLLFNDAPGSTESARVISGLGLAEYPKNSDLWQIMALSYYQLGQKEEAAKAAEQAYILTKDRNYKTLQMAILQGMPFDISK
jgi:protein O-mannosyl-transferase